MSARATSDQAVRPGVSVRPYHPADRDAVLSLAPRLVIGIAPWRSEEGMLRAARGWIEGSIDSTTPDRAVFVAEEAAGCTAGFVSVSREVNFTGEVQAYVGELAVAEEAEGRGVGRALMEAAESWARERGYGLVVLDTGAANVRARGLYARLGYAEESVKLTKVLAGAATAG